MIRRHTLLALAASATLLALAGCSREDSAPTPTAAPKESADAFIARVNKEMEAGYAELTAAQWLSNTYINKDSQLVSAKADERDLAQLNAWLAQAKAYEGQSLSPATARAILMLKLRSAKPPPADPSKLAELTRLASKLDGAYNAGKYCTGEGEAKVCRTLGELSAVLADKSKRDYDQQLEAWRGWHSVSQPMRKDYVRFVELLNQGARDMGFADAGEIWRSGYDMPPAQIAAETDRLWNQIKPLYEQLHCYARGKLEAKYGADKGQVAGGMLPAHLMGNMWQQDWGGLWDILEPYPGAGSLDITGKLEEMGQRNYAVAVGKLKPGASASELVEAERQASEETAKQMTQLAEKFYVSLGMPSLPSSYWTQTQFIKPRDRDAACHASAWDMDLKGDVRTKMCIVPNEEEFTTIYHELGHVYYYLAYNHLPPLLQTGAHDGFHEAVGDTIVLSMTPQYLESIGLAAGQTQSQEALINAQMRMALAKVAFMPFGLMIDRWRWGVFDGTIKPENYNKAWWDLKAKYQGVAPAQPRGEEFFDPGAKYHVPANVPYTRYFLSHVLQFQFYKSLCESAGHKGPLNECSFYDNKTAGKKYWTMLGKGASQPWQQTLQEMTGSKQMDGAAMLEYFQPLQTWLKQQNEGRSCGWQASGAAPQAAPNTPTAPG